MHDSAWLDDRERLQAALHRSSLAEQTSGRLSLGASDYASRLRGGTGRQTNNQNQRRLHVAIRLTGAPILGQGEHRSGWPHALRSLSPLISPDGILFDDFVERTFAYGNARSSHKEPWVGIFHHPPNMPPFSLERHRPQDLFQSPNWLRSLPTLRLAIALSNYHAEYLRTVVSAPVVVVRHPTGLPCRQFSFEAFKESRRRRLIQIGWYLRNTRGIYQLNNLPGFVRTRLLFAAPWITAYDMRVADYWLANSTRRENRDVEIIDRVSDSEYDFLLSRNVAFAEYFDVSASNLIVECLARSTPIVTNRHPALVEYLGQDYPLFFDRLEQVTDLLTETAVLRAHEYLAARDKRFLGGDAFCRLIAREVTRCTHTGPRNGPISLKDR